ncbi:endothelial cell-selective adhesion molecule-like [Patiria miniata]|uniref:Ig-like domain-containing protein n=1 Tax=Patiria miniata TaxID=46514 RepID=A0A914A7Y2_PATMI|nr:endothelial cell-selective adhesion molecule-like [Patiria miniata]
MNDTPVEQHLCENEQQVPKLRWMQYTRHNDTSERVAVCKYVENNFNERMTADLIIREGLKQYSLYIANAQPQDSGEYFCRLYYPDEEETYNSNTALLTVNLKLPKHSPTCEAHPDPSHESSGSTISLTCTLSRDDPPSLLTWFQKLPSGLCPLGDSNKTQPGQSLSIEHVLHETNKPREFICVAGTDSQSGTSCLVTPTTVSITPSSVTVKGQTTVFPDYTCACKTQVNTTVAVLGAILGIVILAIGIVLLRNLLLKNKQKHPSPRRVTNPSFSLRQERVDMSNPVASETGLNYENLPEQTARQPEPTTESQTLEGTSEPKADLYAIPNRRGGDIRHFTLTPQTNKAQTQPRFVSLPRNLEPPSFARPKDPGSAIMVHAKPDKDIRKHPKPIPEWYAPESSSSACDAASAAGTTQDLGSQEEEDWKYADLNLDHPTRGAAGIDALYAQLNKGRKDQGEKFSTQEI